MAFGSNDFPLGPNGQFPKQRIRSAGNEVFAPERMEEAYEGCGLAKLPSTEKDYDSSVRKVQSRMKMGKPHKNSEAYDDLDKFRPKYAPKSSLRHAGGGDDMGDDEWLKRRKQRFPGLGDMEQKYREDEVQSLGGRRQMAFRTKRF